VYVHLRTQLYARTSTPPSVIDLIGNLPDLPYYYMYSAPCRPTMLLRNGDHDNGDRKHNSSIEPPDSRQESIIHESPDLEVKTC
jgi:hypothetical protein